MGSKLTEQQKRKEKRAMLRKFCPDIPDAAVEQLITIKNPIHRVGAFLKYVIDHKLEVNTPADLEHYRTEVVQSAEPHIRAQCEEILSYIRAGDTRDEIVMGLYGPTGVSCEDAGYSPDDSAYRPSSVDSTLTGVGRATGHSAKAIKRGRTYTNWELKD